ncbi:MAG: hypothetical protein ABIH41_06795, partial [Nanoarchaeota archaeon]
ARRQRVNRTKRGFVQQQRYHFEGIEHRMERGKKELPEEHYLERMLNAYERDHIVAPALDDNPSIEDLIIVLHRRLHGDAFYTTVGNAVIAGSKQYGQEWQTRHIRDDHQVHEYNHIARALEAELK